MNWALLWVNSGAPADPEWWVNCHYVILAKLAPFIKAYLAADEESRRGVLQQYEVSQ